MQLRGYGDIELVGEGGLGRVYRAVKVSTGGTVAIKELRDISAGSPAWHRARRELDAMLRLKGHAHVINVEEVIDGPNGPCLIMEYAPGGSLFDRVQRGPLSAPELVLVGQHVCDALTASHAAGVLHRDIKPHNLLVDAFGQVKVCDFGIASLARDGELRTKTGALTMAYASPEELDGSDDIGPAADVYSFAATMLHLASGRRPSFQDRLNGTSVDFAVKDDALTSSIALLRQAFAHKPGSRPSVSDLSASFDEDAYRLGPRRVKALDHRLPAPAASQTDVPLQTLVRDRLPAPTIAKPTERPAEMAPTIHDAPDPTILRPSYLADGRSIRPSSRSGPFIAVAIALIALGAAVAIVLTRDSGNATLTSDTTDDTTSVSPAITQVSTTVTAVTAGQTAVATSAATPLRGEVLITMDDHTDRVRSALFSSDGNRVVTASKDGTARVWDAATGDVITIYSGHTDQLFSAAFSPDGNRVVTASADDTAQVWNATTGDPITALEGHTADVNSAMFSPDGARIVTASDDGTVRVWDANTGANVDTVDIPGPLASAQFGPDGAWIVTASLDSVATVWSPSSGEFRTLVGHSDDVYSAAFSPDGTRVVTASADGTAKVWNAFTGAELFTLTGHASRVFSARFSLDGSRIVTASWDHTARVWGSSTGDELLRLDGHTLELFSAEFSPDGTRVVTASDDDTAKIWYVGSS